MERSRVKSLTAMQKDLILALHKSELTSRQIAEAAKCAQSTVIRQLQKFQESGLLPMTERRKTTRRRTVTPAHFNQNKQHIPVTASYPARNYGMLISPIDEQINPNQRNFLQFSNMMEVKHSPASQMEFRSTTNGLPENEVEDLDTLFDNGVGKSLTSPSDESDSSPPVLNGIVKHSEELTSAEILDVMEIDLVKDETESNDKTKVEAVSTEQNKENEEAEAEGLSKPEIDLFELGLEEESTEKVEEFKDAANVRDTGDDLDTLLSKINDLVEDCMETKVNGAVASSEDEIVEIPDDDVDDIPAADVAVETTEKVSLKMEVEEDIEAEVVAEAEVEVEAQVKTEEELKEVFATKVADAMIETAKSSSGEEAALEQMEVDAEMSDVIVCLDSPFPEESKTEDDELMIGEQEVESSDFIEKPAAEDERVPQKEEESAKMEEDVAVEKGVETSEKAAAEKPKVIIDDEIYLIEDDDDEVPAKDSDPTEKENEIADESEDGELKTEKDIESALEEICRTPEDEHTHTAASEDKPPVGDDDDDDDVVCLDDSDKEDELKDVETQKTSIVKEVLVAKEEENKEEDKNEGKEDDLCMKEVETIDQNEETTNKMDEIKDKVTETTEKVKEPADNVVLEEPPHKELEAIGEETVSVEEISEKPVEDISTKLIEKVVETLIEQISTTPVEETLDKAVDEVEEQQIEEAAENPVEEVVEKPVEKPIDEAVLETVEDAVKKPVEAASETALEEQTVKEPSDAEKPVTKAAEKHVEQAVCSKPDAEETNKPDDKKSVVEPEKPSNIVLDDDIVILDDDEEEDEATSPAVTEVKESTVDSDKRSPPSSSNDEDKKVEESISAEKLTSIAKPSTILSDNSDNARDGVEEKQDNEKANETVKENIPVPSESNSCSNSSNLLKESIPEERENREEQSEQPPAKRIRLSQDEEASSRHSTVSMDDTKSNTVDEDEVMEIKTDEDSKSLKRVHSSESIVSDFKKPKTEEDAVVEGAEVAPVQVEHVKKKEVEVKPLALYPPPKLDAPAINLSLDFLKRFKKSIHKMTKCDLEELVLQKIVEAIVHKSEFSEMRELIEKQEKVISSHRTKITELNKQFRDLEMVHNRVLKDLETKNSQFIMPVKITRAVGLQVFFPNKKYDQPLVPHSPVPTQTSPRSSSSLSNSTSSSANTNSVPERSSTPVTPINTPTSSTSVNTQVMGSNNVQAQVQRRGCVQKLTPMRPDTPRNSPLNRVGLNLSQQSMVAAAKDAVAVNNAKAFNRGLPLKGRPPVASVVGRNAVGVNSPPAALVQTPPLAASIVAAPKQSSIPPGIATKKPTMAKGGTGVLLGSTRYQANQPKNYLSDPQATAQPLPPAATIVTPPVLPSLTTTPKPANKSVIDLTDEDDAVPTATPSAINSPRTTPAMTSQTPPSVAAAVNRGPYKVSVIPQQLLQQPKPNPPKQTPSRPPVPIAPKPNGMAISVRTGPANPSRYRHPAPLPNQPIHSTNPAWKLPPTRPTIRISNLDSGIVISWTIEDAAKEKYAESTSYQIYAYQETSGPPLVESWRHVGDVKAMLLPMAVTLTQFQEGQRYYFAVRAVDAHNRCGPFSFAKTWS